MLQTACQQFLGKSENDIRRIAQETLEGHQRAIMGNMTVEVSHVISSWYVSLLQIRSDTYWNAVISSYWMVQWNFVK